MKGPGEVLPDAAANTAVARAAPHRRRSSLSSRRSALSRRRYARSAASAPLTPPLRLTPRANTAAPPVRPPPHAAAVERLRTPSIGEEPSVVRPFIYLYVLILIFSVVIV